MVTTAFDLILKEERAALERAKQPGTYQNPRVYQEYDAGGKIYQVADGQVIDTGKKGKSGEYEVLGLRTDGKTFKLGDVTNPNQVIQGNLTREQKVQQMQDAYAGTQTKNEQLGVTVPKSYTDEKGNVIQNELTGSEKLTKDKFMQTNGVLPTGKQTNSVKEYGTGLATISNLKNVDFAEQLNLDPNHPIAEKDEDPMAYENRVLKWTVNNISKAYNATMQQNTLNKIKEYSEKIKSQGAAAIDTISKLGIDGRNLTQIEKDIEADSEVTNAKNKAIQDLEAQAINLLESNVRNFEQGLDERAGDIATKELIKEYRESEQKRIDNLLGQKKSEIEKAAKENIKAIAKGVLAEAINFSDLSKLTPQERREKEQQQEYENLINSFRDKINPKTGIPYTSLQAKAEADKVIKSYGTDSESFANYDEFTNTIAADPTLAQDPVSLFETAQTYSKTNEDAYKLIQIFANDKIAKQARDEWLKSNYNYTDEEIGIMNNEASKTEQQLDFVRGEFKDKKQMISYLNNREDIAISDGDEPEMKRILSMYQAAKDKGVYDDDPVMSELINTRMERLRKATGESGSGTDSSFEQKITIPALGKMMYGTRISDKESERIQDIITDPKAAGLGRFELAQKILGFEVEKNEDVGRNLMDIIVAVSPEEGMSSFDLMGLAKLLNTNNVDGAIRKVENFANAMAKKTEGENFVSESFVGANIRKYNDIVEILNKDSGDMGTGPIEGSFSSWLGRLKGDDRKKIGGKMSAAVAKMRNDLLGSAVTEAEEKFLEDVLPKLTDTPEQIASKLDTLKENAMFELNSMRSVYGLPELSEDQVVNKNLKRDLYSGGVSVPAQGYRTDRHKNPTALMWTPGVENFFKEKGYNVKKGDAFPDNPNAFTIDMGNIEDPVEATMEYIDAYGFFDPSGKPRWSHTTIDNADWDMMSKDQKRMIIEKMYNSEKGDASLGLFKFNNIS